MSWLVARFFFPSLISSLRRPLLSEAHDGWMDRQMDGGVPITSGCSDRHMVLVVHTQAIS